MILNGRGERIRTSDPLVPNQVLYQAEPLPELGNWKDLRAESSWQIPLLTPVNYLRVYQNLQFIPLTSGRTLRRRVRSVHRPMTPRQQLDLSGLHVLDGGMATELERKGFDLSGPLWSAHVLESSPEAIADVHRAYLEAGADCLLTASYQVSAEGFQKIGSDAANAADAAANALRASVALAEKVRSEYQADSPRRFGLRLRSDPTARCCITERSITAITPAASMSW